jgi:hypothetical protein
MKVRVVVPQTGLLNAHPWPTVGEVVDLPPHVAESMLAVGHVEKVAGKVETRPAPDASVETRKRAAKKA